MTEFAAYTFSNEGATIVVPEQQEGKTSIIKLARTEIDLSSHSLPHDGKTMTFTPFRKVINFAGLLWRSPNCSEVEEFAPRIALWVRYTQEDWKKASDQEGELRLGYFIQVNEQWVLRLFKERNEFERIPDHPDYPELGGYARALISDWGDPEIVWGTSKPAT